MQWYSDEVEDNLPLELDFQLEANNAQKCKDLFKNDKSFVVPYIEYELSSKRILTMEFVDGISIGDE